MKQRKTKSDSPVYKGVPEQFVAPQAESLPVEKAPEAPVEKEQGMSEAQKTLHRQALRFISKRT